MQWHQWLEVTASAVTVATAFIGLLAFSYVSARRLIGWWGEKRRFAREVEEDYIRLFGRRPE